MLERPDLADDPRYATNAQRVANRAELVPLLAEIFKTRTTAEWLERLRAADVPAAPVNNLDRAFSEPPVAERDMIVEYDHPEAGRVRLPGNPIKLSGTAGTISRPAPQLGQHTDAVLARVLGLSPGRIAALRDAGAVA
jgi:formyl-CoA transferase